MDVKSAFLNGVIEEKVFVKQPPGFEDLKYPDHVYKLKKSLYGLKLKVGKTQERGVELCFQKLFFLTKQQLFSRSESDRVQSLSAADRE